MMPVDDPFADQPVPVSVPTEAMRHDPQAEALIKNCPLAAVVTNPRLNDNPIVAANDKFAELTGYALVDVIGRNCRFLAGIDHDSLASDKIRYGLAQMKPTMVEIINYKKDDTPFRNAVFIAPIFADEGGLEYFVGTQVEIINGESRILNSRQRRAAKIVKRLSQRQREILGLIANGMLNKQIAHQLDLSQRTVKMHRAILMKRIDAHNLADLIRLAVEAGM